ncbi:metacaspase-1, partial [Tremellales sp. Uapishka_1]
MFNYPGQGAHQHQNNQYAANPPPPFGGYGAPPPPQYGAPPPAQYGYQQQPQQGYQQQYQAPAWAPPTNAPPENNYHQNSAGYAPPPMGYAAPSGAPPSRPPTSTQHYGPQLQGQSGQVAQPYFQYSQCEQTPSAGGLGLVANKCKGTGKRKALCIGINYIGSSNALSGCINDAHNIEKFLIERYHYNTDDIVILTDDARNQRQIPTRQNMIAAMQWLVAGAQPNDSLFFHYSGHGGSTKDLDGDEDDGFDEVIYPLDFKTAGHIVDDDHLPYIYSTEGKIKEPNLMAEAGQGLMGAGMSYLRGDTGGMLKGLMGIGKTMMGSNGQAEQITRQTRTSPADVVMWSGCKDSQTSADTQEADSKAFIAALSRNPQQSYIQLLNSIRGELRGKYDQKPQLSASHPMDVHLLFIC